MKKVCIVAFAKSTRDDAPYGDDSWEFWGMNNLWEHVKAPWSRWFDMHSPQYIAANTHRWPEYPDWLRKTKIPVYMQERYEEYPSSVRYPIEKVRNMLAERLHTPEKNFAASTVAYALLLAALEGAPEIALYGTDMVKDSEYSYQKPNCNLIIGLIRGSGIPVFVPERSSLVRSKWLYAYEEGPGNYGQFHSSVEERILDLKKYSDGLAVEVEKERRKSQERVDRIRANYHEHIGALKEDRVWLERILDAERGGDL